MREASLEVMRVLCQGRLASSGLLAWWRFHFRLLTEEDKKVFMKAFDAEPHQLSKAAGKNSKLARLA